MFLGHFAAGMVAAALMAVPTQRPGPSAGGDAHPGRPVPVIRRPSLGTLLFAALLPDLLWPVLLLAGIEEVRIVPGASAATPLEFVHYPYSHSLAFVLLWAALLAGGYLAFRRDRVAALCLAALVGSHWVLDVASHLPDVPLWPGSERLGLGLWRYREASLVIELVLFAVGAWMYGRATRAIDATGRATWWAFLLVLVTLFVTSAFGPPPPSVAVLAASSLGAGLFIAWGYWIARHRRAKAGGARM